jgi:hypothetical protein
MKYFLSIIAIAFLIISCIHGKTQHFPGGKKLADPAEIIIVRSSFACGAYPVTIVLDGLDIAHLRSGEFISFMVEPGYYNITIKYPWGYVHMQISDHFEGQKEYYFSISGNFWDSIVSEECALEIESISEEEGLKAVLHSKKLIEMEKVHKTLTEATPTEKEKPKLASVPKSATVPRIRLRRRPMQISSGEQVTQMLKRYGFFESSKNKAGAFNNHFVDNKDGTVTDKATGLMWQKSGTLYSLENKVAKKYIEQLNIERFAGHTDWRLPNVEQLASLLKKNKINGVHLDPVFSKRQITCWTVDEREVTRQAYRGGWIVNFKQGQIVTAIYLKFQAGGPGGSRYPEGRNFLNYVKAVRQVK